MPNYDADTGYDEDYDDSWDDIDEDWGEDWDSEQDDTWGDDNYDWEDEAQIGETIYHDQVLEDDYSDTDYDIDLGGEEGAYDVDALLDWEESGDYAIDVKAYYKDWTPEDKKPSGKGILDSIGSFLGNNKELLMLLAKAGLGAISGYGKSTAKAPTRSSGGGGAGKTPAASTPAKKLGVLRRT